jgi:hypothetical protein
MNNYLHLPNAYNIQSSVHPPTDLPSMEINEDMVMRSLLQDTHMGV